VSATTRSDDPFGSLNVEHSSTVDRVVEELRRAIFEGDLESGTPLREVALAESLGVSRPTVREALGVLVGEGMATREPHRGVAVATPDPASIGDVSRAREVLELAGVRRWPTAEDADRKAVRTSLEEYAAAVAADASYEELNRRHLAIHLAFVGLTGSPRLVAMASSIHAELRLALAQVERARRNASDQVAAHARLVDLLESGDVAAAEAELERHLADGEAAILERLGLQPEADQ
jgi:DNA-binding GntR family transcriptional regulator